MIIINYKLHYVISVKGNINDFTLLSKSISVLSLHTKVYPYSHYFSHTKDVASYPY